MTRKQLLALRTLIALAEHHIRTMRRSRHRLEWTRVLRDGQRASREVTVRWIAEHQKEGTHGPTQAV